MLRPATANRTSIDLVRPLAPRSNGSIGPLGTKPWNSAMRCSWQDCGIASVLRATYRPLTANGTSNIKLASGTKTVPPKLLLQALGDIYDCVEALGVSPVLAGGLAVSFWGHPRSTQDIDLAILVENKKHFEDELTRLGLKAKKPGRWIDPFAQLVINHGFAKTEVRASIDVPQEGEILGSHVANYCNKSD